MPTPPPVSAGESPAGDAALRKRCEELERTVRESERESARLRQEVGVAMEAHAQQSKIVDELREELSQKEDVTLALERQLQQKIKQV